MATEIFKNQSKLDYEPESKKKNNMTFVEFFYIENSNIQKKKITDNNRSHSLKSFQKNGISQTKIKFIKYSNFCAKFYSDFQTDSIQILF